MTARTITGSCVPWQHQFAAWRHDDPVQLHDPGTCRCIALGPLFHVRTFPFGVSDQLLKEPETHLKSVRFKLRLYQVCSLNSQMSLPDGFKQDARSVN
jgi:hypothetical protein